MLFHVIIINPTAGHHSVDLFLSFLYKIGKVPFVHVYCFEQAETSALARG